MGYRAPMPERVIKRPGAAAGAVTKLLPSMSMPELLLLWL
jgi:hypothetical protein